MEEREAWRNGEVEEEVEEEEGEETGEKTEQVVMLTLARSRMREKAKKAKTERKRTAKEAEGRRSLLVDDLGDFLGEMRRDEKGERESR